MSDGLPLPGHAAAVQAHKQLTALGLLSQLELDIRTCGDAIAIGFMAVNDTIRIVPYDHALLWRPGRGIAAVAGGAVVEPNAPQIRFFARAGQHIATAATAHETQPVTAVQLPASLQADAARLLRAHCLWVPLLAPARRLEGALFLWRGELFSPSEMRVLGRLGTAYGSALLAATPSRAASARRLLSPGRLSSGIAAAVLLAAFIPVRLTVLAEAKVAPSEPRIVAAPIDGVIKEIVARPNQEVARGDSLWSFDTTDLTAAADVAGKRVQVLAAEQARAEQSGFREPKARSEITLLRSRLAEGEAELGLARDRLARAMVVAPEAGVVMFDDPATWIGRPVKVGERVMTVADPAKVRLEIALAVEDALVVGEGAEVEFFLAVAPAEPVPARLTRVSYDARLLATQTAVFPAEAEFPAAFPAGIQRPRLGLTGTAKVYGARAALAYVLLRKPLASLRRLTGF